MIAGHTVAGVSADAQGCTFGSTSYPVALSDTTHIAIWDTAGLNEGENGNVPPAQAMRNLQDLVGNMQGGISLLVYCIRASRFREIWKINYDLFVNIICQGQVRVVLVVTGLEDESPMEKWWEENGGEFSIHGMRFDDHACITSTRGKLKGGVHMYQEEFSESERETRRLILDNCKYQPWVMNRERWMRNIQVKMRAYYEQEARLAQQSRTPQPNAIAGSVERVEVRHGRERGQINAESILPAVLNLFATLLSIFLGPGAVRVR
ncbi:hypothetical protein DXG01_005143 [Tephrocybe rancida]|nr:hypothetical protein DXG01_005143 [Tephrocybe rancida]